MMVTEKCLFMVVDWESGGINNMIKIEKGGGWYKDGYTKKPK